MILDGSIPDREINAMISHSYNLVVAGLPKTLRETISKVWPSG